MSTDYRHAPPAPPDDVVTYRPFGKVGPFAFLLVAIVMAFAIVAYAVSESTSTTLRCERSGESGTCVLRTSWPLIGGSERVVPLASIRGTEVRASSGGKRTYYKVVLVTNDGDVPLSDHGSTDLLAREEVRRKLYVFLKTPTQPSLEIAYDIGSPWALAYLLFLALPLLGAIAVFQRIRIFFEWRNGRIRTVHTRGPFRATGRTFRLDEVVRARLVARPGRRGTIEHDVVLDTIGGDAVSLGGGMTTAAKHHQPVVDAINALLARRESVPAAAPPVP
jgi:hypothetical protein